VRHAGASGVRSRPGQPSRNRVRDTLIRHDAAVSTGTKLLIVGIVLASVAGLVLSALLAFYSSPG
jgi:hypothetical protein